MIRIYHTWDKWECYPAGFYETAKKGMTKIECQKEYCRFLSNEAEFRGALDRVISEWKNSCEHYLTNESMNRIAWLGQSSLCYAKGIPSIFRGGFYLLSETQQIKANEIALEYLNKWINNYTNKNTTMFKSPVYNVTAVPLNKLTANDYNPNKVAKMEMELLYHSILCDGYTQPVVAYYDSESDKYIIVDGFHRYRVIKEHKDIYERENGMLPVVVIEKEIGDRMASTIRHNRARGKHSVELQSWLVAALKENWTEEKIQKELGMTSEEVKRLCGIVGISTEVANLDYNMAQQVKIILDNPDEIPNK